MLDDKNNNRNISIGNHTVSSSIWINLHEWVFQKAEIARAAMANAMSAFWKTDKCKLISNWMRKTVWLLINDTAMKKFARKGAGRYFLKPFFSHSRKLFSEFRSKFLSLLYLISLAYKISHCLSANHNPELRCVICTGITIFIWTALLSANQSRVIFSCVLLFYLTECIFFQTSLQ